MTSRDFCYWLQGFFEVAFTPPDEAAQVGRVRTLDQSQLDCIRRHLALVFKHEIDPSIDGGDPAIAAELQAIHDAEPPEPLRPPVPPHGSPPFPSAGPGLGPLLRC